jgi:hypothetical protein
LNTSGLENVFGQVHHTNCDTADTNKKALIAVSLNGQEHKIRGNNKCLVHLYSSLYGGDHQADEKGGDTFIGNQVVKQEHEFPSLIMSQWNCVLAVNMAQVPNSLLGKSNQYEEYLHKLLGDNPLPCHFSDEFLNIADVTKVAKISCYGPAAMFFSKVFC